MLANRKTDFGGTPFQFYLFYQIKKWEKSLSCVGPEGKTAMFGGRVNKTQAASGLNTALK